MLQMMMWLCWAAALMWAVWTGRPILTDVVMVSGLVGAWLILLPVLVDAWSWSFDMDMDVLAFQVPYIARDIPVFRPIKTHLRQRCIPKKIHGRVGGASNVVKRLKANRRRRVRQSRVKGLSPEAAQECRHRIEWKFVRPFVPLRSVRPIVDWPAAGADDASVDHGVSDGGFADGLPDSESDPAADGLDIAESQVCIYIVLFMQLFVTSLTYFWHCTEY
jgi:hypothetical protein